MKNPKPRGFFNHAGSTGFKINFSNIGRTLNFTQRMANAGAMGVMLFVAIAPFSLPIAFVVLAMSLFMPFTKLPMGILGDGAAGAATETPEQILLKQVKEQTETQLKEYNALFLELKSFKEKDFETQFKALEEKGKTLKTMEGYNDLVAELTKMGLAIKSLKETRVIDTTKKGSIVELLGENKAKIDQFISNKSGTVSLEYKTGGTTETSTDISGRDNYFTWHEGGKVGLIPVRRPFMREQFKNVSSGTEYIKYLDQATIVRDAQNASLCGAITTTSKVTFIVRQLFVDKVKDMTNVCLDMLSDFGFVQGQINDLLNSSLQLKIDHDLLLGNGASPILHGVDEVASTFNAASVGANYANLIPFAQIIDLIAVCGAQIRAFGQQNMWNPNIVNLNPKDHQMIKFLKDGFGNYVKNPALVSSLFQDNMGRLFIDGMLLVANPLVPENELYIYDSSKGTVYSRPGVGIEFAYENKDNFETDTVTLKVYERLNLLIRNVDANAFMHVPDIQAAIAAITLAGVQS